MSLLQFFGFGSQTAASSSAVSLSATEDPDDRYYDTTTGFPFGGRTLAGVAVNEHVAMTYSACWAATMLLSTAISMLPLKLYRRLPGGGSQPFADDPRYSLVHDTPNPEMPSMMFRSSRIAHQVNRGNGYAEIERNRAGQPIALWPIHASRIPPESNIKRRNGKLVYVVNNDDGSTNDIAAENMLHVPSPMSEDGIIGKGVVTQARLSIGFGIAAEKHGASYFGNGARPGIIFKGGKIRKGEDQEEFRRMWSEAHGGPDKSNKPGLLPEGMDVTVLPFNARDSQFLESRQFSVDDIARWYGVPPHTIGSLLRATNNNIEQMALELVKYSLMRWTVPQEQEMNRKLLSKEEQKTMFFLHVFEGLERADITTRTNALRDQFFNGEITLNEWRAIEDRPPIGPDGDKHFVQAAMVPLEIAAKGPQAAQSQSGDKGLSPVEEQRQTMETYGVAVRAGTITPQLDDEEHFRKQFGLPAMNADAKEQWKLDNGTRRPITLKDVGDRTGLPDAVEQPGETPPEDKAPDEMPPADQIPPESEPEPQDDGLSAVRAEVELNRQSQQKLANAMLRDVMCRMLSYEIDRVNHIAGKASKFDARLSEFYAKHVETMTRSLSEPIAAGLSVRGVDGDPVAIARDIATKHAAESIRQLDALLDCTADELPGRVEECVSTWHDERATVSWQ